MLSTDPPSLADNADGVLTGDPCASLRVTG